MLFYVLRETERTLFEMYPEDKFLPSDGTNGTGGESPNIAMAKAESPNIVLVVDLVLSPVHFEPKRSSSP